MAATLANLAALVLWVPQDVIKERQQVLQTGSGASKYRTVFSAAGAVIREGGWQGFYRGFATSATLYTPLCVLYWVFYEDFKVQVIITLTETLTLTLTLKLTLA